MSDRSRRTFLALVGATAAGLAGCTGADDEPAATPAETPTPSPTPTETDDSTAEGDEGDDEAENGDDGDDSEDEEPEEVFRYPAIDYGTLVDGFEEPLWRGREGAEPIRVTDERVSGRHAMRIERESAASVRIVRRFSEGVDVSGKHLSMAVKVDDPDGGRVQIDLHAPTVDQRHVSSRRLPTTMGKWLRVDFGLTRGVGSPDFSDVTEIHIEYVPWEPGDVRLWVDDLRATDGVGRSHAILAFYGGHVSQYEEAFPRLEARGMRGVVALSADSIGREGRMTESQLSELADAGWDIASLPTARGHLSSLTASEQHRVIERNRQRLSELGFGAGARHFFAPHDRIDGDTLAAVRELHETGFVYGGNSAGMPPTAPHTIPVLNGAHLESSRAAILRADRHKQLVVPRFELIGEDGMELSEFDAQLDRLESNSYAGGLTVITASDLVDEFL
ncbi:polysaccharide deacetylase family protein [Natronorarus salvus]|uniref:polysaccharide deacetylase family protein n=1 Tax=Natronorarus salvus TaxID=3117733 RepID=UPI002F26A3F3